MTNKTLEEAKAELTAISGNSYEQINTLDDLAKTVRFECVKAADQVAKLESLHEKIFNISMQSATFAKLATGEEVILNMAEVYVDDQVRLKYSEASIREMADLILKHKLLQPIEVHPKDERGYCVRVGKLRYLGNQLAGNNTIRAIKPEQLKAPDEL